MKSKTKILITLGIGVVLIISFFMITDAITKFTGYSISDTEDKDDFNSCLKKQDITLYINSDNFVKTLEQMKTKEYLGTEVKIMNCLINKDICLKKGINTFPSWIINGEKVFGDISIEDLSRISGCELN